MKASVLKVFLGVLFVMAFTQSVSALSMNPFKREGRTRAHTLLITANFRDPRLLAELAQYRTKQPILVLSPDVNGQYTLFFMPAGTKPMAETADNFLGILDLINPQRVVILGGSEYVPAQFVDMAQKKYPVITLNNADWNVNAETLGTLLDQPKLQKMFADYKGRLLNAGEASRQAD